jgi:NADH:ubiquinone oxidoreductase subunit E
LRATYAFWTLTTLEGQIEDAQADEAHKFDRGRKKRKALRALALVVEQRLWVQSDGEEYPNDMTLETRVHGFWRLSSASSHNPSVRHTLRIATTSSAATLRCATDLTTNAVSPSTTAFDGVTEAAQ